MGQEAPEIIKQLRKEERRGTLRKTLLSDNSPSDSIPFIDKNRTQDTIENEFVELKRQHDAKDDHIAEKDYSIGINGNTPSSKLGFLMNASEQSTASILITDYHGTIEYINSKFTEITGYTLEESIGKTPRLLKSGDHTQAFYKSLWETITSGRMWVGDFHNKRKNGEKYWEHVSISPIIDEKGNIKHFIAIREDTSDKKKLEYDLRIKENAILSSINAIVLTDLKGMITYVNPSFLGMWGYDSEKRVLGRSVISLWRKGGEYVTIRDEVMKDGGWVGEIIAKRYNGKLFPVQMSASLVKDEFDKPLSIMASFVDITKQKRLEKNYKKFKTISDKADYGSFIHTLDGNLLYTNESFARIYGYNPTEVIGQNMSMFFQKDKQDEIKDFLLELKNKGNVVGREFVHVRRDKSLVPLLVTSTVIHDDDFPDSFAAGTVVEISDIKEAQRKIKENAEKLKAMNDELQHARDQLSVLNKDLERKVEERTNEIKKLLKQKDDFINQLGHDLKTPLTPMMVLLPLINNRVCDDKGKEYLSVVEKNIRFMKELVNKTVDLAKLNSDRTLFEFQSIDIAKLIEEVLQNNQVLFENNHVSIVNNIMDQLFVKGNSILLNQLYSNLISNAVKFMPLDGGIITLDAHEDDNMIIVSVKDTGIGISKEQIDHIFDEFYKADESRHDLDSSGLGLSISKKIVEKHGGKITVESQGKGNGTTFHVMLKKYVTDDKNNDNDQSMVIEPDLNKEPM